MSHWRILTCATVVTLVAAAGATIVTARTDARMFRYPAVSATQIAFVYAGDIWVVPRSGGAATRLSSPRGEESFPTMGVDPDQLAAAVIATEKMLNALAAKPAKSAKRPAAKRARG